MKATSKTKYRVIQWATGQIGQYIIQRCEKSKSCELVGCWVFTESKSGKDAGELAGIGPLGIMASNSIDEVLKIDADIVVYAPLLIDINHMCRILESGKNLITPSGFTTISNKNDEARLIAAAQKGGVSLHGSGIHPGFSGDRLPLVISALSQEINKITVYEITNMGEIGESPEMVFDQLGFNMTAADAAKNPPALLELMSTIFFESIQLVADGLDIPIDSFEKKHEFALADEDIPMAAGGVVEKGNVAGQHFSYIGLIDGEATITFETLWHTGGKMTPDWGYDAHCAYYVDIEGKPSMRLELDLRRMENDEPGMLGTAMNCFNTIPKVVAADPGFKTQLDFPMITGVETFVKK
jgi:hypothetical protein